MEEDHFLYAKNIFIGYLAPMVASPDEIKQMDEFFKARTLEKVFKINKGITFTDLPKYILDVLTALKLNHMADAAARPRWEDLLQIRKMLEQADKAATKS